MPNESEETLTPGRKPERATVAERYEAFARSCTREQLEVLPGLLPRHAFIATTLKAELDRRDAHPDPEAELMTVRDDEERERSLVQAMRARGAIIDDAAGPSEIDRLLRWKEEAIEVIKQWELCYEELVTLGWEAPLGHSMADHTRRVIKLHLPDARQPGVNPAPSAAAHYEGQRPIGTLHPDDVAALEAAVESFTDLREAVNAGRRRTLHALSDIWGRLARVLDEVEKASPEPEAATDGMGRISEIAPADMIIDAGPTAQHARCGVTAAFSGGQTNHVCKLPSVQRHVTHKCTCGYVWG